MTNDKAKKTAKEPKADADENEENEIASSQNKEDKKDPHRGITDTPPQTKEMLPGEDDAEGYFDEDGELDEELEDLDDEEDEEH